MIGAAFASFGLKTLITVWMAASSGYVVFLLLVGNGKARELREPRSAYLCRWGGGASGGAEILK